MGIEMKGASSTNKLLRTLGLAVAGTAAVSALGVLLVRDQVNRHRRDLFSPRPLRRLAALTYIGKHPDVENAHLLRDFLSWEREPMLRRRAAAILGRIERALTASSEEKDGANGNGKAGQ
jgi:HEAT repeat protein